MVDLFYTNYGILVGGFKHVEHFPFHKKGMSSFPLTLTPSFFRLLHHQPGRDSVVEIQQLMDIVGDVPTTKIGI
jgi:hypothetical protein